MTTRRRALTQSCDSVDVDSMWRRHSRPGCHTAIKEWESTRDVNLSSTLIVAATNSIIEGEWLAGCRILKDNEGGSGAL